MKAIEPAARVLADGISRLELRGVPGRWGRVDVVADMVEAAR